MSTPLFALLCAGWLLFGVVTVVSVNYGEIKPGATFTFGDAFERGHFAIFGPIIAVIFACFAISDHIGPRVICRKPLKETK